MLSAAEYELMQRRYARLRNLVQTLIDNDPDELAADGGVTVLDVWRKEARRLLANE